MTASKTGTNTGKGESCSARGGVTGINYPDLDIAKLFMAFLGQH